MRTTENLSTTAEGLAVRETFNLIAADKVEGTNVYSRRGDKLGTVDNVMLDKISGKVAYAVMSFGGFLGMGKDRHPLPWSTLNYDENMGGYVVDIDAERLKGAPTYDDSEAVDWANEDWNRRLHDYYGVRPYWG